MSASREKKTRQEQASSGWTDPKTSREAQRRKEEKRSNILYGVIAVAFLIAAAAAIIWKSNIIQKTATAATIDGEKYTAAEVNFYYQNVYRGFVNNNYYALALGYLNLDPNSSLSAQTVTESDAAALGLTDQEVGLSWKDFFLKEALDQAASVQTALAQAKSEGFTFPDSVQAQYESQMDSLRASAQASGISASQYLRSSLGGTMTEKIYGEHLLRLLQFEAYEAAYQDSLNYSESDLENAYKDDKTTYDLASYEYVLVSGSAPSQTDDAGNAIEPTEEESAAAKAEAKETADAILAAYRSGESLETLADQYDNASYNSVEDGSYNTSNLLTWVFDNARKANDSGIVENDPSYYVAVFRSRSREDYNTVAVRHILVNVDESGLDTAADTYDTDLQARKDEARAKAEALLAQWQSGAATEDSFAELANQESGDGGSNTNGGLYSRFAKGAMVQEFNDWSFDSARKPGDTGIVYGESSSYKGYHIMYFVAQDLPYWQVQVTGNLKSAATSEWEAQFNENHTITQGSGAKYVG